MDAPIFASFHFVSEIGGIGRVITWWKSITMNAPTTPETLISLRCVASRLNLSVRAIYRLIARGELPRPVKVGGATRFFESDIARYMESLHAQRS